MAASSPPPDPKQGSSEGLAERAPTTSPMPDPTANVAQAHGANSSPTGLPSSTETEQQSPTNNDAMSLNNGAANEASVEQPAAPIPTEEEIRRQQDNEEHENLMRQAAERQRENDERRRQKEGEAAQRSKEHIRKNAYHGTMPKAVPLIPSATEDTESQYRKIAGQYNQITKGYEATLEEISVLRETTLDKDVTIQDLQRKISNLKNQIRKHTADEDIGEEPDEKNIPRQPVLEAAQVAMFHVEAACSTLEYLAPRTTQPLRMVNSDGVGTEVRHANMYLARETAKIAEDLRQNSHNAIANAVAKATGIEYAPFDIEEAVIKRSLEMYTTSETKLSFTETLTEVWDDFVGEGQGEARPQWQKSILGEFDIVRRAPPPTAQVQVEEKKEKIVRRAEQPKKGEIGEAGAKACLERRAKWNTKMVIDHTDQMLTASCITEKARALWNNLNAVLPPQAERLTEDNTNLVARQCKTDHATRTTAIVGAAVTSCPDCGKTKFEPLDFVIHPFDVVLTLRPGFGIGKKGELIDKDKSALNIHNSLHFTKKSKFFGPSAWKPGQVYIRKYTAMPDRIHQLAMLNGKDKDEMLGPVLPQLQGIKRVDGKLMHIPRFLGKNRLNKTALPEGLQHLKGTTSNKITDICKLHAERMLAFYECGNYTVEQVATLVRAMLAYLKASGVTEQQFNPQKSWICRADLMEWVEKSTLFGLRTGVGQQISAQELASVDKNGAATKKRAADQDDDEQPKKKMKYISKARCKYDDYPVYPRSVEEFRQQEKDMQGTAQKKKKGNTEAKPDQALVWPDDSECLLMGPNRWHPSDGSLQWHRNEEGHVIRKAGVVGSKGSKDKDLGELYLSPDGERCGFYEEEKDKEAEGPAREAEPKQVFKEYKPAQDWGGKLMVFLHTEDIYQKLSEEWMNKQNPEPAE
jgi:hypothetical protein